MNAFNKIFSILTKDQKRKSFSLVLLMSFGAILEAIGISAIMPLLSLMSEDNNINNFSIIKSILPVTTKDKLILYSSIILILFYIIKNIYLAWIVKKQINFSIDCKIYFAEKLNALYLYKPYLFHLKENSAKLISNISLSVMQTFNTVMLSILMLLTEITSVFALWIMIIMMDPFIGIVVAGMLIVIISFIIKIIKTETLKQGKILSKYYSSFVQNLNQGIGSIKETKVSCKEDFFISKFNKSFEKYGNSYKWFLLIQQLPKFFIELIVTCSLLSIIIIYIFMKKNPSTLVPILGVLALSAFRLMPSANRIISNINTIKYYMPSFDAIYSDLLEIKNNPQLFEQINYPCKRVPLEFNKRISVQNLEFSYPTSKEPVLKDISFDIPINSFVGIVGKTGAGKTTFVDILLGLFKPSKGSITVDGVSIYDNIRAWQINLSYVPQSVYLVDGNIRDNIALGIDKNEVDDKQIEKVLKMAQLYDFVMDLPEALETRVGERGIMLSGGQRQRIGIARALYYDPKVLVLDEATSALDNETEKNITDTLLKLKGHITIIAIAHRMSTLEQCDFKVEFEDGKANVLGS